MDTRFDFHIHTTHLRCANETMAIPAILAEGARLGVTRLPHVVERDRLAADRHPFLGVAAALIGERKLVAAQIAGEASGEQILLGQRRLGIGRHGSGDPPGGQAHGPAPQRRHEDECEHRGHQEAEREPHRRLDRHSRRPGPVPRSSPPR